MHARTDTQGQHEHRNFSGVLCKSQLLYHHSDLLISPFNVFPLSLAIVVTSRASTLTDPYFPPIQANRLRSSVPKPQQYSALVGPQCFYYQVARKHEPKATPKPCQRLVSSPPDAPRCETRGNPDPGYHHRTSHLQELPAALLTNLPVRRNSRLIPLRLTCPLFHPSILPLARLLSMLYTHTLPQVEMAVVEARAGEAASAKFAVSGSRSKEHRHGADTESC